MWDVRACRSCLAVKGKLEKIGEALKRQYTAISGLRISDDGYPTYFCMECRHHIKKSLAFRRKSRRAHFVLKEIMAVRKQISYSDIVTVNRRKTNLDSSLNYWEPNNSACYLITNQEGQEGEVEGLQKYNLAYLPLNYKKTYSTHLIDIEPEVVEPIEPPPDETNEPPEERDDNGFNEEDIPSNDYLDTEDTPNIDMNDIFKDLEEPPDDNDDEIEELEPLELIKPKKRTTRDELSKTTIAVNALVDILNMYDIRVLSLEEQKEKFEIRKTEKAFLNAHFKCAVCMTVFFSMTELMEHVEFHNKRKFDFECKVCKNKMPTAEDLNAHMANSHMYEYNCRECNAKFYSQVDAIRHTKCSHPINEPQSAVSTVKRRKNLVETFSITPLSQEMMRDVMKFGSRAHGAQAVEPNENDSDPPEKNWFKCDICGLRKLLRKNLEKHMTLKHRFMYTCKVCKEVFTTRQEALDHGDTHNNQIECDDCGKLFVLNSTLKRHRRKFHLPKKPIPCNLCGYTASYDSLFYVHQLRQHGYISLNDELTGDPQYKCEECSVQFMNQRSLEQHLINMNHKGAESIGLACIPCKKLFEDAEQLDTHYITCVYARKYPRNCCYCTVVLHCPKEYKRHYLREHPTLPYRYVIGNCICDVCGKSVFKPHLEAHLKSHSGEAHACRHCSFTSASSARYLAHVINCHTPRPYLCALCPQRFKSRCNFKRHVLRIHAPTKLYKCDFCGKEFSYFHNLKEHSASLHNIVIPTVKSTFPLNSKEKIYVYAHMRIEINEVERSVVEKTDIELVDYLELKSKPVDYNNYFVFNPDIEEDSFNMKKVKFRRKKNNKPTELETAVAQIKTDGDLYISENDRYIEDYEHNQVKGEMKMDSEMVNETPVDMMKIDSSEIKTVDVENAEHAKTDESLVEVENVECEGNVMNLEDSALPLEVIESEGHQYVMIDGEMYRIAREGEV